ncbi:MULTISPECIES: phosphonate metabolism transcriptional regulator PhnF [Pseudomonas aeruginosa group]|nr:MULTISPECIES: phosphonate metabolism transcriptional regulator PhnF [Pseudomonas aeruginosa group]KSD70567.2 phosphonate metabolism transcriptional regulator PhnF [Pseudomonas aeruginosa]KSP89572.2 phosphonate metabolism transcriptional regulator PhnF [Pseudomonas aeruginosa]MCT9632633.1 phosphonate metabolism transcriptional regulator PhnF [Pseudomonas aeruginosa]MCW8020085.1 phosphonate metabolism transcriptional regulator PhnF [Pseudomonas aeruginosa]MCW8026129.1 phosphonate metabolism t
MRPFQTMHLSRQSEPLYRELAERLRQELLAYRPGDYLPGEIQLAQRFAVNRHTLRRALDELVLEGRVLRRQGKGTQVLEAPTIYPMGAANAYTESLSAQGHRVEARLLEARQRPAGVIEATHLGLGEGGRVLELTTLRHLDGQPVSLIRHCYAVSCRELLADYQGGSLRRYLADRGLPLTRTYSLIGARLPNREEAARLLMPRHAPLLTVLTLSRDRAGQPVELAQSISRADRFQYQVAP